MTQTKPISQLPRVATTTAADLVPIVQGGASVAVPVSGLSGGLSVLVSAAAGAAAAAALGRTLISSSTTAHANQSYLLDSTAAAFDLLLPATPSVGDTVIAEDGVGVCSTHNVTLRRNGQTIDGAAADYLINIDWAAVRLTFNGATWIPRRN